MQKNDRVIELNFRVGQFIHYLVDRSRSSLNSMDAFLPCQRFHDNVIVAFFLASVGFPAGSFIKGNLCPPPIIMHTLATVASDLDATQKKTVRPRDSYSLDDHDDDDDKFKT